MSSTPGYGTQPGKPPTPEPQSKNGVGWRPRRLAYRELIRRVLSKAGSQRNTSRATHATPFNFRPPPPPPARIQESLSAEGARIWQRASEINWYHTIELPHGVITPGFVDHRKQTQFYGLPDDMSGMRALDVATFDGFWAFEMERRGAKVVAVDIARWAEADIPLRLKERLKKQELEGRTGAGFRLASDLLGSGVERREASVYDLTPDDFGRFDVVLVSDLLQHLRDPHRALERAFSLTADHGCAIVAEVYDEGLEAGSDLPTVKLTAWVGYAWTMASPAALKLMLNVAGFNPVEEVSRFPLEHRLRAPAPKIVLKAYPWQRARLGK